MEKLKNRLEILKNANVISEEVYIKMLKLIDYLKEKWDIVLTEENGSMLITHVAMALERIKKGEKVNNINDEVYDEVVNSSSFEKIKKIYEGIENEVFLEKIPEEEIKYIYVNLLVILEKND